METVPLPGTSLRVSTICVGTGEVGSSLDRDASFCLLDTFVAGGGTFLDAAHNYGDWVPDMEPGASEKTIGRWMRERGNRDDRVLATKGAHWHLDRPDVPRLSRADDAERPGGGGHNSVLRGVQLEDRAPARRTGVRGRPWPAGLRRRPGAVECGGAGRAAVPFQSQPYGLFSRMDAGTLDRMNPGFRGFYKLPESRARYAQMRRIMDETGLTLTQVVLGYLRGKPFVTVPIVGCRTPEQVADSLHAADVALTETQIAAIDRASNGV